MTHVRQLLYSVNVTQRAGERSTQHGAGGETGLQEAVFSQSW